MLGERASTNGSDPYAVRVPFCLSDPLYTSGPLAVSEPLAQERAIPFECSLSGE